MFFKTYKKMFSSFQPLTAGHRVTASGERHVRGEHAGSWPIYLPNGVSAQSVYRGRSEQRQRVGSDYRPWRRPWPFHWSRQAWPGGRGVSVFYLFITTYYFLKFVFRFILFSLIRCFEFDLVSIFLFITFFYFIYMLM